MDYRFVSLFGMLFFIGIAVLLSNNRRKISWWLVLKGIALQFVLAFFVLGTAWGQTTFEFIGKGFDALLVASDKGTEFVFNALADPAVFGKAMGEPNPHGPVIVMIKIAGTIIVVSALMAALYHLRIMQWVVWAMAKVMQVVMGTSGSESLAAAANIFLGQTEAPLVIKPYLERMTRSEIMAMMTGGMATIAGGVLALYIAKLQPLFDNPSDAAKHLLTASVLSAPASLVMSKIMIPEAEISETSGRVHMRFEKAATNLLDAICIGAGDGMRLAINVGAMLIAFTALVYLINMGLGSLGVLFGYPEANTMVALKQSPDAYAPAGSALSLQTILGWFYAPCALAMGVPWQDCFAIGAVLGERTVLNEFVAYYTLGDPNKVQVSVRARTIATYALCGFANFTSIAIQIGGIGSLVPSRRQDLANLGFRSMVAGTLACFMTANIAGVFVAE